MTSAAWQGGRHDWKGARLLGGAVPRLIHEWQLDGVLGSIGYSDITSTSSVADTLHGSLSSPP